MSFDKRRRSTVLAHGVGAAAILLSTMLAACEGCRSGGASGAEALARLPKASGGAALVANGRPLDDAGASRVAPYVVRDVNGVKVGLVGVYAKDPPLASGSIPLAVEAPLEPLRRAVDRARGE